MKKLKYLNYSIVMQEVPNEVSLAINISGCPHRCEGCHSKELWEYIGAYLTDDIDALLEEYGDLISCVCFMGGDQNLKELEYCVDKVRDKQLKTCLYTGTDNINLINKSIIQKLDYIKVGRYIEELGGLKSKTTNQRMYDLKNNKEIIFTKGD